MEQPDIAQTLGKQKAENILGTGAEAVAAGNIGCLVQIKKSLGLMGRDLPVCHTIQYLDRAYSGESWNSLEGDPKKEDSDLP